MFLNVDQLEKQLDNKEFQEIGSMASFKVLEIQFQMFINSQIYLNDEYIVMTRNYFLEYTRLDILEFCDTLIQNMDYVKKSIEKIALHKMSNDTALGQNHKSMIQAADQGISHVNDADIRPIYNEEPMAEVQTTDDNVSATGQQHTEQPEFNNEGKVDQNAEQCHDIRPLPAKLTDNMTTKLSDQSLESENVCLKNTVAQFQKDFSRMEAHCVNLELKYQNQVLKEGQQGQFLKEKSNEAKVKNDIDVHPFKSTEERTQSFGLRMCRDLAPQRQEMSVENVSSGLVPQGQKASDYDNSDPVPPRQNVIPSAEKTYSSHQG
ncbi:hypothetical protein Tco_0879337, partial [Tanacetum coccineum]